MGIITQDSKIHICICYGPAPNTTWNPKYKPAEATEGLVEACRGTGGTDKPAQSPVQGANTSNCSAPDKCKKPEVKATTPKKVRWAADDQPSPSPASNSTEKACRDTDKLDQPLAQVANTSRHNVFDQCVEPKTKSKGEVEVGFMLQPETRPIYQDQLVAELKGIYASLVGVENKCIEADHAQSSKTEANKLNNKEWQALIELHRTLLHEHYDLFLVSQHPSASTPLRRFATKHAMTRRMWVHGIDSFLKLLLQRLPASLEQMLTFLYLAYDMMALLYETVPAFEDTWIECLGDLGRYRIAIGDVDIREREIWTGVSRRWYSKASDKSPKTGRLYHHLAILACPNVVQQLYYYTKSLCVPIPFSTAKESIMTLFNPFLEHKVSGPTQVDAAFVRFHGILFSGKSTDKLEETIAKFFDLLDMSISQAKRLWLERGYFIAISLSCCLLGYGDKSNILNKILCSSDNDTNDTDACMENNNVNETSPDHTFTQALSFAVRCYDVVLRRWNDSNILPFVHCTLVFMLYLSENPEAMAHVENEFPWKLISIFLNNLYDKDSNPRIEGEFPGPENGELPRPLPEDYALRGLAHADGCYPKGWFTNDETDENERYFELGSFFDTRKERILYLAVQIAKHGKWLMFDAQNKTFSPASKYDIEIPDLKLPEDAPNNSSDISSDNFADDFSGISSGDFWDDFSYTSSDDISDTSSISSMCCNPPCRVTNSIKFATD